MLHCCPVQHNEGDQLQARSVMLAVLSARLWKPGCVTAVVKPVQRSLQL